MSDKVSIRPDHLAIVWQVLHEHGPADAQIWVFGSRAKGTIKDFSDLDLAIDAGLPLTRVEESNLREAFDESVLPYKVDTSEVECTDLNAIRESLKDACKEERRANDQKPGTTYMQQGNSAESLKKL